MNIRNLFAVLFCMLVLSSCGPDVLTVTITNPTTEARSFEDIEIAWSDIQNEISEITPEQLIVTTEGKEQTYQVIYKDKVPISVLVQASVAANGELVYEFKQGIPMPFETLTFGRLVPERKDDFAWENNKVAYRMYGPALAASGGVSNGIDVWAKRTDKLIIDKWYKLNDYHKDHGEGLDYYNVGRTLGAGAVAPLSDSLLVFGGNFVRAVVLENGPLRTKFKLYYAPLNVLFMGDVDLVIEESRTISLSANSHFNKIEQVYDGYFGGLLVACGIVLREELGEITIDKEIGFMSYQEPKMGDNGQLAISVILGEEFRGTREQEGHLLALTAMIGGRPLTYYMGNSWSKAGFETSEQWVDYTRAYATALKNPLVVSYKQ